MDKCPFCGNEIEEGGKFCGSCGHPLTNDNQAEVSAEPEEINSAPTETPVEPVEAPIAPVQHPVYSAPQQPVPAYNAPRQYGTMTQTAPKKNKKGMVLAIIIGVMVVLGIIAAALTFFNSGGINHSLDGEYKLTALMMGDQDYSSYISYLEDNYRLTINGSDCVLEAAGYKTEAKIDQTKHTISAGEFGTVEFTVDGSDIILDLNGRYTMTFTRQ